MTEETCASKIDESLESILYNLRWMYSSADDLDEDELKEIAAEYGVEPEDIDDEWIYETRSEYGLSFDYVAPETFNNQREGYWRYQISWGGPSEEFRFYASPCRYGFKAYRIEFWYLDWFDGACRTLPGDDFDLLDTIFEEFDSMDMVRSEMEKSLD